MNKRQHNHHYNILHGYNEVGTPADDIIIGTKGDDITAGMEGNDILIMLVCYSLAYRVTVETSEPVITYVERMPKEFAVSFANSAVKRKPALLQAPAFRKWVQQNSSLLAVIALA